MKSPFCKIARQNREHYLRNFRHLLNWTWAWQKVPFITSYHRRVGIPVRVGVPTLVDHSLTFYSGFATKWQIDRKKGIFSIQWFSRSECLLHKSKRAGGVLDMEFLNLHTKLQRPYLSLELVNGEWNFPLVLEWISMPAESRTMWRHLQHIATAGLAFFTGAMFWLKTHA